MKEKIKKFLNKEIKIFKSKPNNCSIATFEIIKPAAREESIVTICLDDVSKKETETLLRGNFKSLNLAGNDSLFKIEVDNFTFISLSMHIVTLDLSFCAIGEKGKLFFSSLLKENTTLKNLDISCNNLNDTCFSAIKNSTLECLEVHSNHFSDSVCPDIVNNLSLKSLDISNNQIANSGADTLALSSSLEALFINNNQISFAGADSFLESNLKKILISDNSMSIEQEDIFYFAFYSNLQRVQPLGEEWLAAVDYALDW